MVRGRRGQGLGEPIGDCESILKKRGVWRGEEKRCEFEDSRENRLLGVGEASESGGAYPGG